MAECQCGNKAAVRLRAGFFKNEKGEREYYESCNLCGEVGGVGVPDVFWDGTPEHGLPDNPVTGQPYTFSSKAEKARFLKENQLREAGDRVKGSLIHHTRGEEQRPDSRADVERALAHVGRMGKDYRRQEYLRILKESNRA